MLSVPTALLLHTTPTGRHYDWLVGTPDYGLDPTTRVWTARVEHPSGSWHELGSFKLSVIDPHRPMYLDYQGPITDGRGHVKQVDRGTAVIHQWRTGMALWDIRMKHFQGRVRVEIITGKTWRVGIIGLG